MIRSIFLIIVITILGNSNASSQGSSYADSITKHHESYVKKHDVVRDRDKKFMQFFDADAQYRVISKVQRIYEAPWFNMETSGKEKQVYRVYAVVHFTIRDTTLKLHVYQSQRLMDVKQYEDHLFIPFTDLTSGEESYENGRYLDLTTTDLEPGQFVIDFNKAYNPYCAYVSDRYNCPVPPRENDLPVAIKAGEKKFAREH